MSEGLNIHTFSFMLFDSSKLVIFCCVCLEYCLSSCSGLQVESPHAALTKGFGISLICVGVRSTSALYSPYSTVQR